jgi:hypothetical protein
LKTRIYIKPFIDDEGSAYVSDWIEITEDVMGLDKLQQQLDNTEFDIGIFRAANCKVKLRNDHGRYGAVNTIESIFKYRRGGSKMRVTWEPGDDPIYCNFFFAGDPDAIVSEEVTAFEGILDDTQSKSPIEEQTIDFLIQGYENLLGQLKVPFSSISNGDSFESVIFAIVNQAPLNSFVTVSLANISVGISTTIDDKTSLENKTCLEALKSILLASSSVLYIKDNVLFVKARTPGTDDSYTFYGWASENGPENILDIDDFRLGEQRILNFVTWKDTNLFAEDTTSIQKYQYRKKEVELDIITNTTKRNSILTTIKDEYRDPKREFILKCFLEQKTLELFLLDKVIVDYPPEYVTRDDENVAIYGIGQYGIDYYADAITRLSIESSARFKIMSRKVDFLGGFIEFGLREI